MKNEETKINNLNKVFDDIFKQFSKPVPEITPENFSRGMLQEYLREVLDISPLTLEQEIYKFVCNNNEAIEPVLSAVRMKEGEMNDGLELAGEYEKKKVDTSVKVAKVKTYTTKSGITRRATTRRSHKRKLSK